MNHARVAGFALLALMAGVFPGQRARGADLYGSAYASVDAYRRSELQRLDAIAVQRQLAGQMALNPRPYPYNAYRSPTPGVYVWSGRRGPAVLVPYPLPYYSGHHFDLMAMPSLPISVYRDYRPAFPAPPIPAEERQPALPIVPRSAEPPPGDAPERAEAVPAPAPLEVPMSPPAVPAPKDVGPLEF